VPGYPTSVVSDPVAMQPAGLFRLDQERVDGTVLVTLHGDADLHSAPELRERLERLDDEGVTALVVDLSEVAFIDSMALGLLLAAMKRARSRDGRLRLVVARPEIRRIFEITLLDRVLAIDSTREEALAQVGPASGAV
jgi:anti-sigma B factor antagonist